MQWAELGPKQIELLQEILPDLAHIAQLHDTHLSASKLADQITREAAHNLDVDRALADMEERQPQALILGGGAGLLAGFYQAIVKKAVRLQIAMSVPCPFYGRLEALIG